MESRIIERFVRNMYGRWIWDKHVFAAEKLPVPITQPTHVPEKQIATEVIHVEPLQEFVLEGKRWNYARILDHYEKLYNKNLSKADLVMPPVPIPELPEFSNDWKERVDKILAENLRENDLHLYVHALTNDEQFRFANPSKQIAKIIRNSTLEPVDLGLRLFKETRKFYDTRSKVSNKFDDGIIDML